MEELKKLPDSEFCNAMAFTWACQLTLPKLYQNPHHDPPFDDDIIETYNEKEISQCKQDKDKQTVSSSEQTRWETKEPKKLSGSEFDYPDKHAPPFDDETALREQRGQSSKG